MEDMNEYDERELDAVVDEARAKLRGALAADPHFFGDNESVKKRIAVTLGEHAPKGTLSVPQGIDAESTDGIMRAVDLTILDRNAKREEVEKVASRAADEHCATVCVYPEHVPIVVQVMQEKGVTEVPPIAVVGFPAVAEPTAEITAQTMQQTKEAIAAGAMELDMVLPTSFREDKNDRQAHFNYIKAVVDAAHAEHIPVKVILETAYLTHAQIAEASAISKIAGADWVKTSTGFAEEEKLAEGKNILEHKGATPHDVALMRRTVGDMTCDDNGDEKPMGVKASGGVRSRAQAQAVLNAGADRIGASGGLDVRTAAEKVANQNEKRNIQPKVAGGY